MKERERERANNLSKNNNNKIKTRNKHIHIGAIPLSKRDLEKGVDRPMDGAWSFNLNFQAGQNVGNKSLVFLFFAINRSLIIIKIKKISRIVLMPYSKTEHR